MRGFHIASARRLSPHRTANPGLHALIPSVHAGFEDHQQEEWPREGSELPANRDLFAAEVCTEFCTASHESHVLHAFAWARTRAWSTLVASRRARARVCRSRTSGELLDCGYLLTIEVQGRYRRTAGHSRSRHSCRSRYLLGRRRPVFRGRDLARARVRTPYWPGAGVVDVRFWLREGGPAGDFLAPKARYYRRQGLLRSAVAPKWRCVNGASLSLAIVLGSLVAER
jgi:hypothetical protein